MKNLKIFFLMLVTVTTIGTFTSCEKEDPQPQEDLWAKYETLANNPSTINITEYVGATFVPTGYVYKLNPYEWNKDTSGYPSIKFVSTTQVLVNGVSNDQLVEVYIGYMFTNGNKYSFSLSDRNTLYVWCTFSNRPQNIIIEYKRQ